MITLLHDSQLQDLCGNEVTLTGTLAAAKAPAVVYLIPTDWRHHSEGTKVAIELENIYEKIVSSELRRHTQLVPGGGYDVIVTATLRGTLYAIEGEYVLKNIQLCTLKPRLTKSVEVIVDGRCVPIRVEELDISPKLTIDDQFTSEADSQ